MSNPCKVDDDDDDDDDDDNDDDKLRCTIKIEEKKKACEMKVKEHGVKKGIQRVRQKEGKAKEYETEEEKNQNDSRRNKEKCWKGYRKIRGKREERLYDKGKEKGPTRLFTVDENGHSEMAFGEMRSRFRHRFLEIRLTVGENTEKTHRGNQFKCESNPRISRTPDQQAEFESSPERSPPVLQSYLLPLLGRSPAWKNFPRLSSELYDYRADNPHVNMMRQLDVELKSSCDSLCLSLHEDLTKAAIRNLREELRGRDYESWKTLSGRGKGVETYSEVTAVNSWITNKKELSTSEWISSLKMTANLAAVRSVPGRSLDGIDLRNSRHHLIRSKIAAALRNKGWIVEEEISCLAENGSTRRVDILAYNADTKQGITVDPMIRFEVGCHQSAEVHLGKKSIYEPTVNYFKLKYALIHVEVFGLLIGGTVSTYEWTDFLFVVIVFDMDIRY
ncbi:hypothetical protein ANN_15627 [Periplaneta americana]|uniref:Uncharacterized protein n=1 Tax=Periplaneta americana TaxID=6978 RepID=A0ABQ8SH52_PERAM|nr:hypothetical protein ANN_15627 [Periplaneta americana]